MSKPGLCRRAPRSGPRQTPRHKLAGIAAGSITAGGDPGSATVFFFGGLQPPRFRWVASHRARGTGPTGQDKIARGVGRIENRYKLAKLFDIAVAEDGFTFGRNHARIADEARLDGSFAIRTLGV